MLLLGPARAGVGDVRAVETVRADAADTEGLFHFLGKMLFYASIGGIGLFFFS